MDVERKALVDKIAALESERAGMAGIKISSSEIGGEFQDDTAALVKSIDAEIADLKSELEALDAHRA